MLPDYGVRLARPLLLRRARSFRPDVEEFRTRNPWRLFFRMTDGWYVRWIVRIADWRASNTRSPRLGLSALTSASAPLPQTGTGIALRKTWGTAAARRRPSSTGAAAAILTAATDAACTKGAGPTRAKRSAMAAIVGRLRVSHKMRRNQKETARRSPVEPRQLSRMKMAAINEDGRIGFLYERYARGGPVISVFSASSC